MTQAKHESGPLTTLRSDGVRKSLAALLSFQDANSGLSVRLNYLTTAEAGKEAGSALPDGAGGIAYWRLVARGADLEPFRELLLATQKIGRASWRARVCPYVVLAVVAVT